MTSDVDIDYSGARGSNTGDEFHELWAARECLRLLEGQSDLQAVKVEGTRSANPGNVWESADCTLYFGGRSNSEATSVEIQQLKYSAASPNSSWTVARISTGKNGKPTTSVLRGLANAFSQLKRERTTHDAGSLKISLISNQPIHSDLRSAIELARKEVPPNFRRAWKVGDPTLHRLVKASGLSSRDFHEFAKRLDLTGLTGSRFSIVDNLLKAMTEWTDVEFVESTDRLRTFIRQRMMPETAGEIITRDRILVQLGVSDERALFPCPPLIKNVSQGVQRQAADQLSDLMRSGTQKICLHGGGGVGKTTVLQQVGTLLPEGSTMIVFDCYGGGSYLDASALRHRPQEAFVQLSNELASRLRLPMLLDRRGDLDYAKAFRRRLDQAADLLRHSQPNSLLVIVVDAADNSIAAAQARASMEPSFVHDFLSLQNLPHNVRFLVSARTGRLHELNLPSDYHPVELQGFTADETAQNVQRHWDAPQEWIDEFHHLSNGVPRVQAYAFDAPSASTAEAIEFLRPSGKKLDQIFHDLFQLAVRKLGQAGDLKRLCAGLIALPRPIPVPDLAAILQTPETSILDICSDLAPGVTSRSGFIGFADEDFETFVRESAETELPEVIDLAAQHLLRRHRSSEYAALNVAPLLRQGGRESDLVNLVESNPEPDPSIISDPVVRQEVRMQRLGLAIKVCRNAGDAERALRFVLIGAEAKNTEAATRALLTAMPILTARFARDTGSRLILGDADQVEDHGPILLQLIAEDARTGDSIAVRNHHRRFQAWSQRREDDFKQALQNDGHAHAWKVTTEDACCLLYAELLQHGPDAAIRRHRYFRPFEFSSLSAKALVDRLAAERRFSDMQALAAALPPHRSVFVLVPLAMAGQPIDAAQLAKGLEALVRRFKLGADILREVYGESSLGHYYADTLISGVEILCALGHRNNVIHHVLSPILDPEVRRIDKRYDHEVALIDAILRSYTLSEALAGREALSDDVLISRPKKEEEEDRKRQYDRNEHDEQMKRLLSAITGIYVARANLLVGVRKPDSIEDILAKGRRKLASDAWRFDRRFGFSSIRSRMAASQTVLLAIGGHIDTIAASAWAILGSQWLLNGSEVIRRLTPVASLHEQLLKKLLDSAEKIRRERSGAEDKSRNLASYARLLTPISPDDAQVVFQQAVEVASELDSEIMDQIRLLDQLAEFSCEAMNGDKRACALQLSHIVEDAAIRLENVDHFPWSRAMSALARVDVSVALGCAARWHDRDIAQLSQTLPPILNIATAAGELSSAVSFALTVLAERVDGEQLEGLLASAQQEGVGDTFANELAQDWLLNRSHGTGALRNFVARHSAGEWSQRYLEQDDFQRGLSDTESQARSAYISPPVGPRPCLESHRWQQGDLVDGALLSERARQLLQECRDAGELLSLGDVLSTARIAVTVGDRARHLSALATMLETTADGEVIDALLLATQDWSAQPAIISWCRSYLPKIISRDLPYFSRYLPWEDKHLTPAIQLSGLSDLEAQAVLLEGIENNSEYLSAAVTFAIVGSITGKLDASDAAKLLQWYVERLAIRIPSEVREPVPTSALPACAKEAVARFFFAFLGDVDLRIRWRAGHALRRLARLGEREIFDFLAAQYNRTADPVFRDPGAPFYWIASRLWLVIALDRIAVESPDVLSGWSAKLLAMALNEDFPHLIIRDYARDAIQKLHTAGIASLSNDEIVALEAVNKSKLAVGEEPDDYIPGFDAFPTKTEEPRRFHFDTMDTLRYWYNPWLRVFEGLSTEEFLTTAERWIVDEWGTQDEEPYGSKEPRTRRFTERDWELSSNRHGSLPTLERHRSYLEWHAMWCSVGQLLRTHRLSRPRYDDENHDELAYQISQEKLTHAPIWLADVVQPRPLQQKRWSQPNPPTADWFSEIDDSEFFTELWPSDRPGYLIAHAYIDARWQLFRETVRISSALVSPRTASSLLRALQTMETETDYYLGPENSDSGIEEGDYRLLGWLQHPNRDPGLDEKDRFSNDIRRIEMMPGERVTNRLGLTLTFAPRPTWCETENATPAFIYEAWDEPERDERERYYGDQVVSSGYRLLVHTDALSKFLEAEEMDLIVEIGVRRHERGERQRSYDSEDKTEVSFDRLVLLRRNGETEGAERGYSPWRATSPRVED